MKQPARGLRRKPAHRLTDGGNHALNLINTFKKDSKGNYLDRLTNYGTLLSWAEETKLINWDTYLILDLEQLNNPHEADLSYCGVRAIRNCLEGLFDDLIKGRQVHSLVLERFNYYIESIHPHLRYEHGVTGLRLCWHNIDENLDVLSWIIIAEACHLLDSGIYRNIKKCPICGSMFIDNSRRHNRIWCSPQTCGSLKKSQNYYRLRTA